MKRVMRWLALLLAVPLTGIATAGPWTLPAGRLYLKTAVAYHNTDRRFCTVQDARSPAFCAAGCAHAGDRAPFDPFTAGRSEAWGIRDGLEIAVQIPLYRLRFTNRADPDRPATTAAGDIRFGSGLRLSNGPVVSAFRILVKAPTGRFTRDAEVINVSEGQWDLDLKLSAGGSGGGGQLWWSGMAGYRFRGDNSDLEIELGDEWLARLEGGVHLTGTIAAKTSLDWARSDRPVLRASGRSLPWRRERWAATPSVLVAVHERFTLEGAVEVPVSGRDGPAGAVFLAGGAVHFDFR